MAKVYETVFSFGGKLNPTFSKATKQARNGTDEMTKSLERMAQEGEQARSVFGKLSKVAGDFGGALYKVTQFSGAFALVQGVADTFTDMVGAVGEYQSAMKQIQAATGMSAADMAEIQKSAKALYGQNLGEGFDDLADAITVAKQVTQQQGTALEETTKNALVYRDVFKAEIPESVKAADTMMKNFGISSTQAFNLLAQGAQKGLDKSGELLDTANEYAPQFAALGFTADQMFDTFSAGLEAGAFNLDKVGDAVKEFNIRAKDGSKTTAEGFAAIGMNAAKMSKIFASGGPAAQAAFKQVIRALDSIKDPTKRNIASVNLFGTQFEDLEKNVISAMGSARSQFDMTKDTMEEITSIKYDTVSMAFRGIGRQIMTSFILPLGDKALSYLQQFGAWFTKEIPVIQGFFGRVSAGAGMVLDKLGSFAGPTIRKAASSVKAIFSSLFSGDVEGASLSYAKLFGMGDSDAKAISSGVKAVFEKLTDLGAEWFDAMRSFVPEIKSVVRSIGSVFKQLMPVLMKLSVSFYQAFANIAKALIPVGIYLQSKLWPIVSKVFKFLANDVAPAVSRAFSAMLPTFISVAGKIGGTLSALFNVVKPIINGLVAVFNAAFPVIKAVVTSAIQSIGGILNGLMTTLGGVLDFITGVFTGNWTKAWTGVREIFGGIFGGLKSLIAFPLNAVIKLVNKAIESINGISVDIPEWLGGGSLGFDIPKIPEIPVYAKGGIADRPSIFGEAGPEIAIPLNNKTRSHALLDRANQIMGHTQTVKNGAPDVGDFHFNPTYNFYGNADEAAVRRMESATRRDFEKEFNEYMRQRGRVSMAWQPT
jgi:phage-related minor tail protein